MMNMEIDTIISAPLVAASNAHTQLCQTTRDFIDSCMIIDTNEETRTPQVIEFQYERYTTSQEYQFEDDDGNVIHTGTESSLDDNNIDSNTWTSKVATGNTIAEVLSGITLRVPLICILTIPSLGIDNVSVEMTVEVNEVTETTSQPSNTLQRTPSIFKGQLSSTNKSSRKTNNSSSFTVSIQAKQQPPPEGLSRLLDMLNDQIAPED